MSFNIHIHVINGIKRVLKEIFNNLFKISDISIKDANKITASIIFEKLSKNRLMLLI